MKLVLLTAHTPNGEPQHRYVAHQLAAAYPDELCAIIVATGRRRSLGARQRGIVSRYSLRQILSRVILRCAHLLRGERAARHAAYDAVFFPGGGGETMPPDRLHHVPVHNGVHCKALLDRLRPDVIVTYGTLIIRPDVIARASVSALNMHTGLSPVYRGSDTIFWALHNGEPENLGVTIHRVTPEVDAGAILFTARPSIHPDDDEPTLFAKAVKTGVPLLIEAIRQEYAGLSRPCPQDLAVGREYRSVERTLSAERRVRRRLAGGLLRSPTVHQAGSR